MLLCVEVVIFNHTGVPTYGTEKKLEPKTVKPELGNASVGRKT